MTVNSNILPMSIPGARLEKNLHQQLANDTNLVFRLVEHFMWGAQSSQHILAGISKVDVPLQGPHFGVGHDTGTAGCTQDTKQDP